MLIVSYLINSVWSHKMTETEKVRNDIYKIGVSFFLIAHPRAWKGTLKAVKKKDISFIETDKKVF